MALRKNPEASVSRFRPAATASVEVVSGVIKSGILVGRCIGKNVKAYVLGRDRSIVSGDAMRSAIVGRAQMCSWARRL
jgi:hypothetical protein